MSSRAETLSGLALSRGTLDRSAADRARPGLLDDLVSTASTRVAELRGDRMRVVGERLMLRPPVPQDRECLMLYLGQEEDTAYLAVVHDEPPARDPQWHDLRKAGLILDDRDAGIFTTTQALAHWHRVHGFCPRCGGPTRPVLGGWVRECDRDGSHHFPRTDPAVIVSVVGSDDRLLLGRAVGWLPGRFSVLAGFVEPGESIEAAVVREVHEESGIHVTDVRYLGNQPWPFPSSLMIGCTAQAMDSTIRSSDDEMAEVMWIDRETYLERLVSGDLLTPGGISIARRLIERWLGQPLDGIAPDPIRWTADSPADPGGNVR